LTVPSGGERHKGNEALRHKGIQGKEAMGKKAKRKQNTFETMKFSYKLKYITAQVQPVPRG